MLLAESIGSITSILDLSESICAEILPGETMCLIKEEMFSRDLSSNVSICHFRLQSPIARETTMDWWSVGFRLAWVIIAK